MSANNRQIYEVRYCLLDRLLAGLNGGDKREGDQGYNVLYLEPKEFLCDPW